MKKAHIQTFGCQMNEHDSQRMIETLKREGYEITPDISQANLVLLNTCSVRENPENKVYSLLGKLRKQRADLAEELIIGVGGCVAQQEGKNILRRDKTVDMVFGTDNYFRLPEMLKEVQAGKRVVYTDWMPREKKIQNFIPDEDLETGKVEGCKAYIAITKGCNNYCAFCIVPTTRGRLVSRELENILQEANNLVNKGAKEITLLGQNVNSYQANDDGFYELLDAVAAIEGLQRLRFTSPYPNDWNNRLTDLMAKHPVICSQLHLPFQAGSDRILKLMRRQHTQAEYLEKMAYLQKTIPNIELSTDLIVGFPTETDEDFEETMKVLKEVGFANVYAFKYSPRPGTRASENMEDDVPRKVKEERLKRVLDFQQEQLTKHLEGLVGSTQEILVDNAHPKERFAMNGRTSGYLPVTVLNSSLEIGDFAKVKIVGKRTFSLIGEVVPSEKSSVA
ncbi:MAG: tRNA-2-methylthio-N6-dimethylallyladenosine synthase [bacterium]|jgi:tRNA-2-methylthio-N6-dimethylallyladenosine synthase